MYADVMRVLPSLSNPDDLQLFSIFGFDPFDSLQLWIHHERPSFAAGEDGGVFS